MPGSNEARTEQQAPPAASSRPLTETELVSKLASSSLVQNLVGADATSDNPPEEEPTAEADEEEGTESEVAEPEDDADEAAEEDEAESPEEESEGEEVQNEFEVDGKSYSLEQMREFIGGGLRQKDYTQKTQKLAEERKSLAAERNSWAENHSALTLQQQQNAAAMGVIIRLAKGELDEFERLDWRRLQTENPAEYQTQMQRFNRKRADFEQLSGHIQQEVDRQQKEYDTRLEMLRDQSLRKLPIIFGEWNDSIYGELRKYAVDDIGFPAREFEEQVSDRFMEVLDKARKYDAGEAKAKQALEAATKGEADGTRRIGSKRTRKGSSDPSARQARDFRALKEKARKTGSIDDAAQVLMADPKMKHILTRG